MRPQQILSMPIHDPGFRPDLDGRAVHARQAAANNEPYYTSMEPAAAHDVASGQQTLHVRSAQGSGDSRREFFVVGRPEGGGYQVWHVEPAPDDPSERQELYESLGLEAEDAWGGVSSHFATTACEAAELARRAYSIVAGLG
ncbi:hypothetical protein ABR737_00445 [Streptomyces sp. Edi2]|uniref:hypothetical protein n=1 Tax=Streptomyces sp. Edi2 TaxID=3162528 RepID=UPI0033068BFA